MAEFEVPDSPVFDPNEFTNPDDRIGAFVFGLTSVVVNGGYEKAAKSLMGGAPVPGPVKGLMAGINATISVGLGESIAGDLPKGGELAVILGSTVITSLYGTPWGIAFTAAMYGLSKIENPGYDTGITPYAADGFFGIEFQEGPASPAEVTETNSTESFTDRRDRIMGTPGTAGYLGDRYVTNPIVNEYVNAYASGDLKKAADLSP